MEFRFNKKDMIEKFKNYINRNATDSDTYGSSGKEVQYRNEYYTLDKIRTIYKHLINLNKLDIRKEFIHDDDQFYNVLNQLYNRVENKIRSRSDGDLYMSVGVEDPLVFDGSDDQYKEYVFNNKQKQQQLIRRIVDELNSVLEKNAPKEEDRAILIDTDLPPKKKDLTNEDVANILLQNIPEEYIVELHRGKFVNFDKSFNVFIREHGIDEALAKDILGDLHTVCAHNEIFWNRVDEADRVSDVGASTAVTPLQKRRKDSREKLHSQGLEPRGGVWKDKEGNSVAKIDDKGNIERIDSSGPAAKAGQSISAAISDFQQQNPTPSSEDFEQPEEEEEVETGLGDKELETVRKTFEDDENTDERE